MSQPFKNADWVRATMDPRMFEALHDIASKQSTLAQQVNGNITGQPQAPPGINSMKVTAQNGHFSIAIQDSNQIYRGISYFVEHADNPHFTNPSIIHIGASRNHDVFLGNVTRYWRAYSAYGSSPAGPPVYHGGAATPLPVTGGGAVGGPSFAASQGSGTGTPGQGLSGPGPVPFRSPSGKAPVR